MTTHLFIHFVVTGCIAVVCLCRLNKMNRQTKLTPRMWYVLLLNASLTAGSLPVLFDMKPTWDITIVALIFLILILLEMPSWRHGQPQHLRTEHRE